MKIPTLSIVLAVTFAAVSCSGVRASSGSIAASAGRNAIDRDADEPRDAEDGPVGDVRRHDSAATPIRAARMRSAPSITRRARVPVGDDGDERRGKRGRDRPDDRDGADRGRSARLVCVDGKREGERVLADDRPGSGELEPAEVGVREDAAERGGRLRESQESSPHRSEHCGVVCVFQDDVEDLEGAARHVDGETPVPDFQGGRMSDKEREANFDREATDGAEVEAHQLDRGAGYDRESNFDREAG